MNLIEISCLRMFFAIAMIISSPDFLLHAQEKPAPVKIGVVGLVHTHVHGILGRQDQGDIEIVGIAEPNTELARRYAKQHGFSVDLVYPTLTEMLQQTQPEAVAAFNSIYDHLAVVRVCAPRKIHVMVEKPLAVNLAHALEMATLAREHDILLLTNYETTWYASNAKALQMVLDNKPGPIRKIVVHDGHQGPREIGVNEEFLQWLTNPKLNGGGALTDFGCYGVNLITQLMNNQKPVAVTAITQHIKPDVYPHVEDEATILLQYPTTQGISLLELAVQSQGHGSLWQEWLRHLRRWHPHASPPSRRASRERTFGIKDTRAT